MSRARFAVVAAFVTTVAAATPGYGQGTTGPRPGTGLFGGSGNDTSVRQSLDATVSVAGAYEQNGTPEDGRPLSIFERTGAYEAVSGGLTFMSRGERMQWGATGGSNLRYTNSSREVMRIADYGAVGIAARLGRRWTVFANQAATCGPLHFQGLLGGAAAPVPGAPSLTGLDYSLDRERACTFDSAGSVGLGLGPRTSIEFSAGVGRTVFDGQSAYRTLTSESIGGRFLHNLSQRVRLRVGFVRRTGEYLLAGANAPRTLHDVDIGLDYQRPLSLTRRTYVDFNVGSTAITTPPRTDTRQTLQYRFVGDAGLNHEFGRTWRARLGYNRGVDFIDGFSGPVFATGVNASVNGFFTRRLDFTATASTADGELGTTDAASAFRAYTASTRLRFALARAWALYGEYTYYSHDLAAGIVAYQVPYTLDRQSARIGLTWWIPLVRR